MAEFKSKITAKVEGGKLLRMELELSDSGERVKSMKITGDFFIHPEDSLQIIEKTLLVMGISEGAEKIADAITGISKSQGIQMIGITPQAIASAFIECVKRAKEGKIADMPGLSSSAQSASDPNTAVQGAIKGPQGEKS